MATHEGLEKVADAEAVCHDGPECQQREQPRGLRQAPHGRAPLRQRRQEERERARKVGRGWGIFYVGVRFALFRRCGPRVRGEQWRCGPRVVWRLGDGALHTSG